MELLWLKDTLSHGEFLAAVAELGMKPRKAQYLMAHGRECLAVNSRLPYHPNPRARDKYATVAFLEPPPEVPPEKEPKPKQEPGTVAPRQWNVTDTAKALLDRFEVLTANRSPEECGEVQTAFDELCRDYIQNKVDSIRLIRSGGGQMIDDDE